MLHAVHRLERRFPDRTHWIAPLRAFFVPGLTLLPTTRGFDLPLRPPPPQVLLQRLRELAASPRRG